MPQSTAEKKDRFSRMFPPRVETLIKTLKLLGNCTNKSNYEWNQDLVKRAWIEVAKKLEATAAEFDIEFAVTVDGQPCYTVDTSEPLQ